MVHRKLHLGLLLGTPALLVAGWLGFLVARSRQPELGIDPKDAFTVFEEGTFIVPEGKMAVFTGLGSRDCTITEIGIHADGEELARAWGSDVADEVRPIFALAQAGQTVEVFGGLIRGDDAFALGYLRPQPGSPGDPATKPPGLH
jgi:hypothetical protein